jgi:O-antigen/teichoic acid export membrane protein
MFVRLWTNPVKAAMQAFLSRVLNDVLLGAFVVAAGVVVCARDAMLILASRKYEQSAALVPVLVAGLMLNVVVSIFYAGIYLEKRTWTMARLVVSASLVNVALNLLLLPRLGIPGAVYATLGSYSVLLLMTARACHRVLPLDIPWTACGGYLMAAAAGVAAALPIRFQHPALNLTVRGGVVLVVYGVVLWLINPRVRALLKACRKEVVAVLSR